jgi:hypothetical protein
MSDCIHGYPEWSVCNECCDDASEKMQDRINILETENAALREQAATQSEWLKTIIEEGERFCNRTGKTISWLVDARKALLSPPPPQEQGDE